MSGDGNTLIINLGLRSIRAIIYSPEGKKLAHSWLPVKTVLGQDTVEQDPSEWWTLAKRVIKESRGNGKNIDVRYVTVTSSASCLVPLHRDESVAPAIMVSDKRSAEQARRLKEDASLGHIFNNRNFLPVSSFMWPKIMWLAEHDKQGFKNIARFAGSNDYLLYKLTGKLVTDPLNAEKFYVHQDKGYPKELMDTYGLTPANFPKVREIGTNLGPLSAQALSETGLPEHVEAVLTTYDALCAFWGSGITEEGQANNVCGTCSSIRMLATKPAQATDHTLLSQHFSNLDAYVIGGSNNLEGGLLEWAKSCFYGEGYYNQPEFLFQLMEEEAKESIIGAEGLIFLPHIIGERAPFHDEEVRGVFFGLERKHTRKQIIRSIYESIGFLTRLMLEAIEATGHPVHELRISGGLARNELIAQLKADITGKVIHILDEIETTSFGAFMLTRMATDKTIRLADFKDKVSIRKTFRPNSEEHHKYSKIYKLFKTIYEHNKENFVVRNSIFQDIYGERTHTIDNL